MTTLFGPASRCGTACIAGTSRSRASWVRRTARATGLAAVLAATVAAGTALAVLPSPLLPAAARQRAARGLLRRACVAILAVLGVRLAVRGRTPDRRALVVANHVSWLDIVALLAGGRVRIVAKAEVATWPVVGRLARLGGTIFIDRDRPKSLPATLADVRAALDAGDVVAVFAEGTTTCGAHGQAYRPAMFQAAIDAHAPVVPLAIGYRRPDGTATAEPAFIGDETLIASLRRVLALPGLRVGLSVGTTLHPHEGASRRGLARVTRLATPAHAVPADDRGADAEVRRLRPRAADRGLADAA